MVGAQGPLRGGYGGQGGCPRCPKPVLEFRVADDIVHELFVLLRMTKGGFRFNWTCKA